MRLLWRLHPGQVITAAALCLGACHHGVHPPPEIRAVAARGSQQVDVDVQPAGTVITVGSPSGIGSAEVMLAAGAWPSHLLIRLALRGLEELRLTQGDTIVVVSVASDGTGEVSERLSTRAAPSIEEPLAPESPYWMNVAIDTAGITGGSRAPLRDGHFEVTVAPTFLRNDHRSFSIGWIDFYR